MIFTPKQDMRVRLHDQTGTVQAVHGSLVTVAWDGAGTSQVDTGFLPLVALTAADESQLQESPNDSL